MTDEIEEIRTETWNALDESMESVMTKDKMEKLASMHEEAILKIE